MTENLKGAPIDEALLVLDTEVVDMVSLRFVVGKPHYFNPFIHDTITCS